MFLSPWLIGFAFFFAYPLLATFYFSFFRYDLFTLEPVGLDNWKFFWTDADAHQALLNTLWLVAVMVPLRVLFGLGIAQLLTHVKRGGGLLRAIFYLPYLLPPVAGAVAFVFLLNPATGPINSLIDGVLLGPLNSVLGTHWTAPDWFNDPSWSKPGLTLLALWSVGDVMIILLAALLDVPKSLYEAASIDGAGAWQRFRRITLPTVQPVLMFAAVTGVIQTLQYFTQAIVAGKVASGQTDLPGQVLLPGYPNGSTLTFPQWLNDEGFRQFNMGYASVLSIILFAISMFFTLFLLRSFSAFGEDEAS
ncbi:sugar ABC transporter permease [Actinocorallia longicatena]|uniref:Sugar ABC transporter permease n=2 Tax=Actinocorallia longicatena TaxID=111803 RepID=A0ABP6Q8V4_9ACTN